MLTDRTFSEQETVNQRFTDSIRDNYWDSLKFLLIVCVVVGHMVSLNIGHSRVNMAVFNFIYMFHMPLFVFISGRFSQIHDKKRFKYGIANLMVVYIIFQTIRTAIDTFQSGRFDWYSLITPNWILWYLLALCIWRLTILTPIFSNNRSQIQTADTFFGGGKILCASFVVGSVAGFLPIENILAIQRVLAFFPFFLLGYYTSGVDVRLVVNKTHALVAILFLIFVFQC